MRQDIKAFHLWIDYVQSFSHLEQPRSGVMRLSIYQSRGVLFFTAERIPSCFSSNQNSPYEEEQ